MDAIQKQVLRQKSWAIWITARDSNTVFSCTPKGQTVLKQDFINMQSGDRLIDPTMVQQEFTAFFQQLLDAAATESPCLDAE